MGGEIYVQISDTGRGGVQSVDFKRYTTSLDVCCALKSEEVCSG